MSAKLMEAVGRGVETVGAPPKARTMPSGAAVAALMAAMLGMLALAVVNVFTAASKDFNTWVHDVGKLWMPGATGIGPYSGKETISLLVWLERGLCCTTRCADARRGSPPGWSYSWWVWGSRPR
jgi:hypothetical protein